jgi:uncharacterized membrane protein
VAGVSVGGASQAFTWTSGGGSIALGFASSFNSASFAAGVNIGGTTIVGTSESATQMEAAIWNSSGASALGFPTGETSNAASAVTPDGSVVVGFRAGAGIIEFRRIVGLRRPDLLILGPCLEMMPALLVL